MPSPFSARYSTQIQPSPLYSPTTRYEKSYKHDDDRLAKKKMMMVMVMMTAMMMAICPAPFSARYSTQIQPSPLSLPTTRYEESYKQNDDHLAKKKMTMMVIVRGVLQT